MALNVRKDPKGAGDWVRVPECDVCCSMIYYSDSVSWVLIAQDSGWRINARTGLVICDRCNPDDYDPDN